MEVTIQVKHLQNCFKIKHFLMQWIELKATDHQLPFISLEQKEHYISSLYPG